MVSAIKFYRYWKEIRKWGFKKYFFNKVKNSYLEGLLIYLILLSFQILFLKKTYGFGFIKCLIAASIIVIIHIIIQWGYNEYRFKHLLATYKTVK